MLTETQTPFYAWAVIPNHFHLLLRTGPTSISTVMRRLLTGYAGSFNRRHRRYGHLFQNRYKSFLCQEDTYFLELVRYLHLNPLRANLVEDLKQLDISPYAGHSVLMGKRKKVWQDTDYVLQWFNKRKTLARRRYRDFVKEGIAGGKRPDLVGGGLLRSVGGWSALKGFRDIGVRIKCDERLLGSSEFVERVLKQAGEKLKEKYRLQMKVFSLAELMEKVAHYYEIDTKNLKSASKERVATEARRVLCYIAVRKFGYKCTDVSKAMRISAATVSKAATLGSRFSEIEKIQNELMDN